KDSGDIRGSTDRRCRGPAVRVPPGCASAERRRSAIRWKGLPWPLARRNGSQHPLAPARSAALPRPRRPTRTPHTQTNRRHRLGTNDSATCPCSPFGICARYRCNWRYIASATRRYYHQFFRAPPRCGASIEELLQLAETIGSAESPTHALRWIEHRSRFTNSEIETGDGLDEVPCFVVHHDGTALAAIAIQIVGNEEQLVDRIDRDVGAAVDLVGVVGARKLHGGDAALAFQVIELHLRVQLRGRRGDAGSRIDGESVDKTGMKETVVEALEPAHRAGGEIDQHIERRGSAHAAAIR